MNKVYGRQGVRVVCYFPTESISREKECGCEKVVSREIAAQRGCS